MEQEASNTAKKKTHSLFIDKLEEDYVSEFAVTPFDGLLVAVHKDAFQNVTGEQSVLYNLTKYGKDGRGTGALQFLTPGSVLPSFLLYCKLMEIVMEAFLFRRRGCHFSRQPSFYGAHNTLTKRRIFSQISMNMMTGSNDWLKL